MGVSDKLSLQSLPRITRAKRLNSPSATEVSSNASGVLIDDSEDPQKQAAKQEGGKKLGLLSDPRVRRVVVAGFFMEFLMIGFDAVFVLWSYTPLSLGGLQRKVHGSCPLLPIVACSFGSLK